MSPEELLRAHIEHGLQAHAQGDIESAKDAYQQALIMAPDHAQALNLLGAALLQLGRAEEAVEYLKRAAGRLRDNPGVMGNLAQAYFALGRYEESGAAFRKASRMDPREVQFQLGVATSAAMQGKLGDAEALLRRLASRFPNEPLVWFNLGNVTRDLARPEQALESYRKALEFDPRLIDARNNLGGVLQALLRFEEAECEYRQCIEMAPDYPIARCNLASALIAQGRFGEAEAVCRELIRVAPELSPAHALLGSALSHQGRLLDALEFHRIAAELAPRECEAAATYAAALVESGRAAEGLHWFSRALAPDPGSTAVRQKLGPALLANGSLADGWVEYRHRPAFLRFREKYSGMSLAQTLPEDLDGKHICVLREQGLGDEIFFLRYARELSGRGARITYRGNNKVRSLLARAPGIAQVLDETAPLPPADAVILAGDLPHALSVQPASELSLLSMQDSISVVPTGTPHVPDFPRRIAVFWPPVAPSLVLKPLEEKIEKVRRRLAAAGDPPYLGVTWRGGIPPHEQRTASWTLYKEIGKQLFAAALREVPGTFLALQRNPVPGEIEAFESVLGRRLHDFTDLNEELEGMLALLALIEEYVGVSNTNMHLRAAAGKTARVLVPCPAEWRWMYSGRSSPWFPGFPIYRQSLQGDWGPALAALKQDLGNR